jgi:hypothetical protein
VSNREKSSFGSWSNVEGSASPQDRLRALEGAPLNMWIVLSEDESQIVAEGATFEDTAAQAQAKGISDPILIRTPEKWVPRIL